MTMNQTILKAKDDIAKVDAILRAYEKTYLDAEVIPEEFERKCSGDYMFYVLVDAVKEVAKDIEHIEAGSKNRSQNG